MSRLLLGLVALPSLALAQVSAVVHADASRGATLLPDSVAWADQATAIALNPAGLSKVGTFELFWAHERSVARDQIIDGVYLASAPINNLGLGLSIEWLRNGPQTISWRKTSVAAAYGGEALS